MAISTFLVNKFGPLYFTRIAGYPHYMPPFHEWNENLSRFSGNEYEDPVYHLQEFHECMEQQSIICEDGKMKLFMFSLDQEARVWYKSLHC